MLVREKLPTQASRADMLLQNWFQNRRAKEKQMRKTAEFEAQQARERAASESKSSDDQDQGVVSEFYGLNNQHQPLGLSTASFGDDSDAVESDDTAAEGEFADSTASLGGESPASSDSGSFVHIKDDPSASPAHQSRGLVHLAPPVAVAHPFSEPHAQAAFQQPTAFAYRPANTIAVDGLPRPHFDTLPCHSSIRINDAATFSPYNNRDYFATPSVSQFPSEMLGSNLTRNGGNRLLRHETSTESLTRSDAVSPSSIPDSPSTVSELRFKSPPPPADIASRRKMRRPAPLLGLTSLRGGPGPKTGIEAPRRADTASPMRRISSATGSLCGRVQKTFMGSGGPRSPFAMDRNKEALLQSLQSTQAPIMASLNDAMSPMSSDGMGTNASDDKLGYPFSSLGAVNGLPLYNGDAAAARTPPDTPGLQTHFHEPYLPNSFDHAWNFVPQDEPLPTPSLCSHGGSELEFSMAPQLPGYVASQPVTPSFPPSVGPTYAGYFGTSLGHNTEYHFPDSYPAESSARSSPVAPPRSKQFQFAQNITPQDFNTDKS
jgi:hypothetical protein